MVTDSCDSGVEHFLNELKCHLCGRKDQTVFIYRWDFGRTTLRHQFCTSCKDEYRKKISSLRATLERKFQTDLSDWFKSRKQEIEISKHQLQLPLSNG